MSINDWMQGDGTDALVGTTLAYLIDNNVTAYIQDPLDVLLPNYKRGCAVTVASTTTFTVAAGEIVCSNAGGTANRFRKNAATVTASYAGVMVSGTLYYVYATADTSDTAFAAVISDNSSFPAGVTYAKKLHTFKATTGGTIPQGNMFNNKVFLSTYLSIRTGTTLASGTLHTIDLSTAVGGAPALPTTSQLAFINFSLKNTSGSGNVNLFVRPYGFVGHTAGTPAENSCEALYGKASSGDVEGIAGRF